MWPGRSSTVEGCSGLSSSPPITSQRLEYAFSARPAFCRSTRMSSSTLTRPAFGSVGHSALPSAVTEPRTASKPLWIPKRTSQWPTPLITTVPGVPEPQETPQTARTDAMVIRTVHPAPRMARPVRTEAPTSVEAHSVDRSAAAVSSHFRGAARMGMTMGPLSLLLAGVILTTETMATLKPAVLKIRKQPPKCIFKI
jgi:hypothetical protein